MTKTIDLGRYDNDCALRFVEDFADRYRYLSYDPADGDGGMWFVNDGKTGTWVPIHVGGFKSDMEYPLFLNDVTLSIERQLRADGVVDGSTLIEDQFIEDVLWHAKAYLAALPTSWDLVNVKEEQ